MGKSEGLYGNIRRGEEIARYPFTRIAKNSKYYSFSFLNFRFPFGGRAARRGIIVIPPPEELSIFAWVLALLRGLEDGGSLGRARAIRGAIPFRISSAEDQCSSLPLLSSSTFRIALCCSWRSISVADLPDFLILLPDRPLSRMN